MAEAHEPTLGESPFNQEEVEILKAYTAAVRGALDKVRENHGAVPAAFLEALLAMTVEHAVVAESLRTLKVGRAKIAEADPEKGLEELPLPFRAHVGEDIGYDLCTAVDFIVGPGEQVFVPTGFIFDLPVHGGNFRVEMKIEQRTGTGTKGLFAAAKTVDAGYRPNPNDPEGLVLSLRNVANDEPLVFKRGDRIAQAIFAIKYAPDLVEVPKENIKYDTGRGPKKFGDTGA